jgi:hypothetical protein
VPTITGVSTYWNAVSFKWELRVTGTDITGSLAGTYLSINGRRQTAINLTPVEAWFEISNVTQGALDKINLYWEVGRGNGEALLSSATLALEPKVVSVSPSTGSVGGTLITINVQGLGPDDSGVEIVDGSGASLCQSVEIYEYGVI